jgi:cytoskeleton protein RodZ
MQTIGERLEEARKRKGISVREAAESTKIRSDYLQKFEANSFDLDLPPLYIRGFVRNYARFLDLDQERFIAEYDSVVAVEGRGPRRSGESRENLGRVDFAENAESGGGKRSSSDQEMILKYVLLGGGAIAVILIIILLINLISSPTTPKPTTATTPLQTTPSAVAQSAEDSYQTVIFTAIETTSLNVLNDSNKRVLFNGELIRGESKSFKKQGSLKITVIDRTKLRLEINGKNYSLPALQEGNKGWFMIE